MGVSKDSHEATCFYTGAVAGRWRYGVHRFNRPGLCEIIRDRVLYSKRPMGVRQSDHLVESDLHNSGEARKLLLRRSSSAAGSLRSPAAHHGMIFQARVRRRG